MMCATLFLANCSYFDTSQTVGAKYPAHIDLMGQEDLMDTSVIATSTTDGRVRVYSLDDVVEGKTSEGLELGGGARVIKALSAPSSGAVAASPSVEIFPLDGAFNASAPVFKPERLVQPGNLYFQEEERTANYTVEKEMAKQMLAAAPVVPETSYEAPEAPVVIRAPRVGDGATTLYFGHDSKVLDSRARAQVSSIAKGFDPRGGKGITVEGHASTRANYGDEIERKMVNLKVSMDRAYAVVRSLVRGGVPAESIRTVAWGEVLPSNSVDSKGVEAASRRVEIITQ